MYQRTLSQTISEITKTFPILLITGPRQVGKTTLLELCAQDLPTEQRNYVTLDDLDVRHLAQNDPGLFIQKYPYPLIIDEIQYAPQLFSYLKIMVDRHKENGMYWLTGSQKFSLMRGVTESLAGRVAVLDLLGLSQSELNQHGSSSRPFLPTQSWIHHAKQNTRKLSLHDVYNRIWLGSFPRAHEINPSQKDIFYRSYVQTYIQRDVQDILKITDDAKFTRFLITIAARTGQLLNYTEVSKDVGIDNKTVVAWLSILETSGLIYLLRPYHTNITKRLTKTPKLYFLDTGLCTYLTKWPDPASLEAGAMSGAILETYLISELLKSYLHNGLTPSFYFYRDFDQKEVDLIIETGDTLYPIEFKKTATPSLTACKNFHFIEKLGKKVGEGAVICFVEKDIPLSATVTAIPIAYL
ncbi:MAG: ATP-binding protein [Candidatus Paracaedibacteraceae bacterium]|nr:ATP-binding protein [Candidatus Paracaedibacteraceae bacterium]